MLRLEDIPRIRRGSVLRADVTYEQLEGFSTRHMMYILDMPRRTERGSKEFEVVGYRYADNLGYSKAVIIPSHKIKKFVVLVPAKKKR